MGEQPTFAESVTDAAVSTATKQLVSSALASTPITSKKQKEKKVGKKTSEALDILRAGYLDCFPTTTDLPDY